MGEYIPVMVVEDDNGVLKGATRRGVGGFPKKAAEGRIPTVRV
jgi:hypothetical protein